ncbi:MAG: hypothetical protein JWR24_1103, partial [Actinoallomurus sp.]|nr:hypothetical protein [Actinoallomurus sp.]
MSSPSRIPSYAAVLRTPRACRVFGAALLGRLSYGILPLSLVLALTGATRSYAVAAGVCVPPLGPVMRTLWSELLSDPALLRRGYSLDTVAEELLFVAGPLLAGLVANFATPSAGVALSAGLVLAGTLALVSSAPVQGVGRSRDMTAAGPRRRSRIGSTAEPDLNHAVPHSPGSDAQRLPLGLGRLFPELWPRSEPCGAS